MFWVSADDTGVMDVHNDFAITGAILSDPATPAGQGTCWCGGLCNRRGLMECRNPVTFVGGSQHTNLSTKKKKKKHQLKTLFEYNLCRV